MGRRPFVQRSDDRAASRECDYGLLVRPEQPVADSIRDRLRVGGIVVRENDDRRALVRIADERALLAARQRRTPRARGAAIACRPASRASSPRCAARSRRRASCRASTCADSRGPARGDTARRRWRARRPPASPMVLCMPIGVETLARHAVLERRVVVGRRAPSAASGAVRRGAATTSAWPRAAARTAP